MMESWDDSEKFCLCASCERKRAMRSYEREIEIQSENSLLPLPKLMTQDAKLDRAIANSPPPLGDVGDDVSDMMDEGMGMLKGDEIMIGHFPVENAAVGDIFQYEEDVNPHVVAANLGAVNVGVGVQELLAERQKTHGSFRLNALHGQELREMFRSSEGWIKANARQREALDYIAGKLARILSGQPGHADHWDDIAGYAKLAVHPDLQR
jgi:hypothetical protein